MVDVDNNDPSAPKPVDAAPAVPTAADEIPPAPPLPKQDAPPLITPEPPAAPVAPAAPEPSNEQPIQTSGEIPPVVPDQSVLDQLDDGPTDPSPAATNGDEPDAPTVDQSVLDELDESPSPKPSPKEDAQAKEKTQARNALYQQDETALKSQNLYKLLGLHEGATDKEIEKAFRKAAAEHHPDRQNNDPERKKNETSSEEYFKAIYHAADTLKDPQKRQAYNQKLKDQNNQPANNPQSAASNSANQSSGQANYQQSQAQNNQAPNPQASPNNSGYKPSGQAYSGYQPQQPQYHDFQDNRGGSGKGSLYDYDRYQRELNNKREFYTFFSGDPTKQRPFDSDSLTEFEVARPNSINQDAMVQNILRDLNRNDGNWKAYDNDGNVLFKNSANPSAQFEYNGARQELSCASNEESITAMLTAFKAMNPNASNIKIDLFDPSAQKMVTDLAKKQGFAPDQITINKPAEKETLAQIEPSPAPQQNESPRQTR